MLGMAVFLLSSQKGCPGTRSRSPSDSRWGSCIKPSFGLGMTEKDYDGWIQMDAEIGWHGPAIRPLPVYV